MSMFQGNRDKPEYKKVTIRVRTYKRVWPAFVTRGPLRKGCLETLLVKDEEHAKALNLRWLYE